MKYVLIFIGLMILAFISFMFLGEVLRIGNGDEVFVGISVLAMQSSVIITFLIYLVLKQKKKLQ
ncbi:hypothetical protein CSV72_12335 [Sporosarcina sp. P20a]|nr:hypothetical protein CSV72_12335 [Sporosarcina sp. P20a]